MVELHIVAGLLSLIAGGAALAAPKGSPLHRKAGLVFAGAMIAMTASAFVVALILRPNRVNVVAAAITFYLVCTALLTVKRRVEEARRLIAGLAAIGLATGVRALLLGLEGLSSEGRAIDEVPAFPLFLFAVAGILGSVSDLRLLRARAIEGARRLVRHLWRMTLAMWIATASFFLGQAQFIPEPMRRPWLLALPVLLVAVMLFYWLARVLIRKGRAVPVQAIRRPTPETSP